MDKYRSCAKNYKDEEKYNAFMGGMKEQYNDSLDCEALLACNFRRGEEKPFHGGAAKEVAEITAKVMKIEG